MAKNRNIDKDKLDIVEQYLQLSEAEGLQGIDIHKLSTIIQGIRDSMLQEISLKYYGDELSYFNAVLALKHIEEVGYYLEDEIINIQNEFGHNLVFTKGSETEVKKAVEARITPLDVKIEFIVYLRNQTDKIYSEHQINAILALCGYAQHDFQLDEEYPEELALNVNKAPNIIDPLEQYPNTKPVFSKLKKLSADVIKKAAPSMAEYLAGEIDDDGFNAKLSDKLENYLQEEFSLVQQIFETTTNYKNNPSADHVITPVAAPRGVANKVKTIVQELSDSGLDPELIARAEPHIRAYLNGKTSRDTLADKLTGEFLQGDNDNLFYKLEERIGFVENVMNTVDINAAIAENPNAFGNASSTTTNRHMPQDYLTKDTYDKNEVHNILVGYNNTALYNAMFIQGDKEIYEMVSNLLKEYPYHTLKGIKLYLLKYIEDSKNEKYNFDTHPDSLLNIIDNYLAITEVDEVVSETMEGLFAITPNNKDSSMLIASVSKLLNHYGEDKATDAINKYLSTRIQIFKRALYS